MVSPPRAVRSDRRAGRSTMRRAAACLRTVRCCEHRYRFRSGTSSRRLALRTRPARNRDRERRSVTGAAPSSDRTDEAISKLDANDRIGADRGGVAAHGNCRVDAAERPTGTVGCRSKQRVWLVRARRDCDTHADNEQARLNPLCSGVVVFTLGCTREGYT